MAKVKCPQCNGRGFETGPYMGEMYKSHWTCSLCKGEKELDEKALEEWDKKK